MALDVTESRQQHSLMKKPDGALPKLATVMSLGNLVVQRRHTERKPHRADETETGRENGRGMESKSVVDAGRQPQDGKRCRRGGGVLEEKVKDGDAEAMWMLGVCCEVGGDRTKCGPCCPAVQEGSGARKQNSEADVSRSKLCGSTHRHQDEVQAAAALIKWQVDTNNSQSIFVDWFNLACDMVCGMCANHRSKANLC